MDALAGWVRRAPPMQADQGKTPREKARLDDLTAQLQRAEQNLQIESLARLQAERLYQACQEDTKAAKRWAAKLDEESAALHKQQVTAAQEVQTLRSELELLKACRSEPQFQASPTPSEQQSQDCMRAMASTAAAAEARAKELQEQQSRAEKELSAVKGRLADAEGDEKLRGQELAELTGQVAVLQKQLSEERATVMALRKQLKVSQRAQQATAARISVLEDQMRSNGLEPASEDLQSIIRGVSEGEAGLLEELSKHEERQKGGLSVSLPSPLHRSPPLFPELEASLCNMSSPATLTNPLQKAALKHWVHTFGSPTKAENSVPQQSRASAEENLPASNNASFSEAPSWAESKIAADNQQSCMNSQDPKSHADPVKPERQPSQQAAAVKRASRILSAQMKRSSASNSKIGGAPLKGNLHLLANPDVRQRASINMLRASDFAPLGKNQAQLQSVHIRDFSGGSPPRPDAERQPLSPANRDPAEPRQPGKSPHKKPSPLKPAVAPKEAPKTAETVEGIISFPFSSDTDEPSEECGPLRMGSRGIGSHVTPKKERSGHSMHKGLLKFAHKVSPLRIAGRTAPSSPGMGY